MRHAKMRLLPIALLLGFVFADTSRAEDPYIHAPSPPYCSARGDEPDCLSTEPWRSRGKYRERWLSEPELGAEDVGDIAEFIPNLWFAHPLEEAEKSFIFLGSAKLQLFGPKGGPPISARIVLESKRLLSKRRVRRLKRGFRGLLSRPTLAIVDIERFVGESRIEAENDWCELERQGQNQKWEVYCEVE